MVEPHATKFNPLELELATKGAVHESELRLQKEVVRDGEIKSASGFCI